MTLPQPDPESDHLHRIERRIEALYADGHTTGYGAGRATHPRAYCAGCLEVRRLSHDWDDWWNRWSVSHGYAPRS